MLSRFGRMSGSFTRPWMVIPTWENQVQALPQRRRKYNLDLQALRLLTLINVPPFAYHADTTTFTFFQNLGFFHGVVLPSDISDPHRGYGDIALLSLVLDFHGQFADPDEPFVQAVHPNILDAARGLPFSPFECTQDSGSGGWQANSYAVAEIFGHVADLEDMHRDVVSSAIRDAYKVHGFGDDPDQLNTGLTYPTLAEVLQNIESIAQVRHIANVAARCRPLLEMNLFRPIANAPDLLTLVSSGLVIDLHNLYVEMLQQAAGAFVLRKIYKDMFSWGYAKRIRLAIVLDEAHRLAKDVTLSKIMREGRKFGIAVIVASQGLGDFHADILGNAGTKVIFRMNFPDSKPEGDDDTSPPGAHHFDGNGEL